MRKFNLIRKIAYIFLAIIGIIVLYFISYYFYSSYNTKRQLINDIKVSKDISFYTMCNVDSKTYDVTVILDKNERDILANIFKHAKVSTQIQRIKSAPSYYFKFDNYTLEVAPFAEIGINFDGIPDRYTLDKKTDSELEKLCKELVEKWKKDNINKTSD